MNRRRASKAPASTGRHLRARDFRDLNGRPAPWVSVTDLRSRPGVTLGQAIVCGTVVITRDGEPVAVMFSLENFLVTALGLSDWRAGKRPVNRRKKRARRSTKRSQS